jgi:tetratricopeptide (TPR) repeat protein
MFCYAQQMRNRPVFGVERNKKTESVVVWGVRALRLCCAFTVLASLPLIPLYGQTPAESAGSATASIYPLWGNLVAGPYRVGFRRGFRFDTARTWQTTRDFRGDFTPDLNGRPVQVNVWYPAATTRVARQMRFADYVDQTAPQPFSKFNVIMNERNQRNAADSVSLGQLAGLQTTPMNAYLDAPPAAGSFPVVLYFGGLDADINSNVILAEYLASHGYIVASISLVGPTDEQSFQSRTSDDLEASVRDMEFAWSVLAENSNVDKTKLAVMGHSVGGIEAALFAMSNANVSAVIALDGTYGFAGLSSVLTQSYGYAPEKMRTAFLDLRRAQGAQGDEPLDFTAVESFRHSDRTLITIRRMHHSDFTSFAMIGEYFHTPITADYPLNGWNRETAKAGHEHVCTIILAFLEAKVRGNSNALASLSAAVMQAAGGTFRHEDARPLPPSPLESAALVKEKGLVDTKALFSRICGDQEIGGCIDADRFNTWGYDLLGQNRPQDALAVFQLAAWAHPTSANAQDSLADGYLAVGDKTSAKLAVQRAIELAPGDPLLKADARASFLSDETARLSKMQ